MAGKHTVKVTLDLHQQRLLVAQLDTASRECDVLRDQLRKWHTLTNLANAELTSGDTQKAKEILRGLLLGDGIKQTPLLPQPEKAGRET